ncbi:MAG: YraN family protein, partial [Angustibacter sp.]
DSGEPPDPADSAGRVVFHSGRGPPVIHSLRGAGGSDRELSPSWVPEVVAMAAKDDLGSFGEELAEQHLVAQGYQVLDRNWRCELGEVDIILRDGNCLVFCEVKTRSSARFGSPLEAITVAKLRRLRRLAAHWLVLSGLNPPEVRIDIVGVLSSAHGDPRVEHLRAVA